MDRKVRMNRGFCSLKALGRHKLGFRATKAVRTERNEVSERKEVQRHETKALSHFSSQGIHQFINGTGQQAEKYMISRRLRG